MWLGTEWIATLKYDMECDSLQWITLGCKGTEWIAMWSFCYETWWEMIPFFNVNYQNVDWELEALEIFCRTHCAAVEGPAYRNGQIWPVAGDGKSGRWGGTVSEGERSNCDLDRKTFLYSDLLNLCLRQKFNITEFFPDRIVFFDDNNSRYKVIG